MVNQRKNIVKFESSNLYLNDGFKWAKKQALVYMFENDLVGYWYEAALPGRQCFCMRDVSHQTTGGQILGLIPHNKNMLLRFAQSIAQSRDYCCFWEIDKEYRPCPVDYTNDDDFWYNLPANFDVIDACWRMYEWTGDKDYITSIDFNHFYDLSVKEYVELWDKNADGLLESFECGSRRGIPSYDEGIGLKKAVTMIDLVAIQAKGYESYANICKLKGDLTKYNEYMAKCAQLRDVIKQEWWNEKDKRFYDVKLLDGTMSIAQENGTIALVAPAYYEAITDKMQLAKSFEIVNSTDFSVEVASYVPGMFYKYGEYQMAYQWLKKMIDPNLYRRKYPEDSYCAVGYYATGIMGIKPFSHENLIETTSGLPEDTSWARMVDVPVFDGVISIEHNYESTIITNETGKNIVWKARFNGEYKSIKIDEEILPSRKETFYGKIYSYVLKECKNKQSYKAIAIK